MVLLNEFNIEISTILWNLLYTLIIVIGFIIIFIIPAYLLYRIVELIKKRFFNAKNYKKSFSMFIFYGFFVNLSFTIFLATVGLLNQTWAIYTLSGVMIIGAILVDLIPYKFKFKDYFLMWKTRFFKLKNKIKDSSNYFYIIIFLMGVLIVFSSVILPFPVGEDMIGHSLYLQLIYEQNTLIPILNERISPIIITTNVVQYPLFAHYIAVLNYAFAFPILKFTTPQFLSIFLKIWILIIPITIKETSTKIFGKRIGNISFIMAFVFSPAYYVIWRWGGFAYTFGLIFFNITAFIFFNWKEYHIIEYFLLSIVSVLFVLISHTVVFSLIIVVYFSGVILYLWLKFTKNNNKDLIEQNKKPFYLSMFISIGFICSLILIRVITTLLKYRDNLSEKSYPYSLYLGLIGLIAVTLLVSSDIIKRRIKNEKTKLKNSSFYYIPFWSGIILLITSSIIALLFIPKINNLVAEISLVKTLFLSSNSTTPIIDFEFIGSTSPILGEAPYFIIILFQIFSNFYINGLLAIVGIILLIKNTRKNSNIYIKLFTAIAITSICFLVYYGLSMINALSFLAFKFPLAFFIIRYERLFITFLINITPILSGYVICKYLINLENAKVINEKEEENKFIKNCQKLRNFFIKNKKAINTSFVLMISVFTLSTYTYIGYFRTSLFYSNDIYEAAEWIRLNTNENDRFIVDSYGSWITFTTNRQISFAFLAGSTDIHRAIVVTVQTIEKLLEDTAREIFILSKLGYKYVYLSTAQPNDILNIFYYYNGYYYTFDTFNNNPYIDVVFRGETDMILYLNTTSFTPADYDPTLPFTPNLPGFELVEEIIY